MLPKLPFGLADVALTFGLFVLIYECARLGRGMVAEFHPPSLQPQISLDPHMLPYYAARSTIRMFLALGLSVLFTLGYGYLAAKNKRAGQVLIPLLDILQSVPVLAFLTVVTDMFIGLFPGSLIGLEAASIFAVFTGQAWNMTFSFYHSIITLPKELDDAAKVFRFSKWRRFVSVEVPASMIGLVWNSMMSFGGGWFFVAVSEIIQPTPPPGVRDEDAPSYALPGLGAYVKKAFDEGNAQAMIYASLTMLVVIVLVDQLFWRPLVAWSEKFRMDRSSSSEHASSWLLDLIYDWKLPRFVNRYWRRLLSWYRKAIVSKLANPAAKVPEFTKKPAGRSRINGDVLFGAAMGALLVIAVVRAWQFVTHEVPMHEVLTTVWLGILTLARVLLLLALATLTWTPVGVYIGFKPKLARLAQPIVQFLSSFPALFVFPIFTVFFIKYHIHLNWGSILLMALGTQWYILFNSIAGAISMPTDLREMASNMGLRGVLLWRKLIMPAIFPAWVTGAITASGGAWNASIIAEVTEWKGTKLQANGLGAYLVNSHDAHDIPRMVLAVTVMCLFVVTFNRMVWRKLYHVAETKFNLS